jgi:hypothetical protein
VISRDMFPWKSILGNIRVPPLFLDPLAIIIWATLSHCKVSPGRTAQLSLSFLCTRSKLRLLMKGSRVSTGTYIATLDGQYDNTVVIKIQMFPFFLLINWRAEFLLVVTGTSQAYSCSHLQMVRVKTVES